MVAKTFNVSQVLAGLDITAPAGVSELQLEAFINGQCSILGTKSLSSRWTILVGDTAPETGNNAGCNFSINAYGDDGTFLFTPMSIDRKTGAVTFSNLDLGDPSNIVISGGDPGDILGTDGNGNLDWVSANAISEAPTDGLVYGRSNEAWLALPDLADAPNDGKLYGRQSTVWTVVPAPGIPDAPKDSNVYGRENGNWVNVLTGTTIGYLPLIGGSLTGPLNMQEASGTARSIFGTTALSTRWEVRLGDATIETGLSNIGSNFALVAYDDASAVLSTPLSIVRANGAATFNGTVNFTQPITAPTITGNTHVTGNLAVDGSTVFIGTVTATAFIASISSDARVKQVLDDYRPGLDEISQLRPVAFRYLGNEASTEQGVSPHNEDARNRTVHVGLVAQEMEELFPGMVSHHKAFIDGQEVNDLRKLDTRELVYALVNSVKTLKNQVDQLRDELSEERLRRQQ